MKGRRTTGCSSQRDGSDVALLLNRVLGVFSRARVKGHSLGRCMMGSYLVAFVEYAPAPESFRADASQRRDCFATLHSVRNADPLLGEFLNGALAKERVATDLSEEARKRRALQHPGLIGSEPTALEIDDLDTLPTTPWVERWISRGNAFPPALSAVTEAVRGLGPGARLLYWFEHD